MNAIISLCHFCELHGPSVVFCTQAFRDLLDFDSFSDLDTCDLLDSRSVGNKEQPKVDESQGWRYGQLNLDTHASEKNSIGNEYCIACRSFPHNKPGFISNDDTARVSYVSSQYPLQSELYVLVRQGCIRSLSCEDCPGKEGPIYFGDEARGHVLSYTFFLRDVQARGFQRWYSILILMKDKMLLLNSWPFLVRHLRETISHLQEKASKIYENEESKVSHRALRSAASMMDNTKKQRSQSATRQARSLPELVGDEKVWQHLHTSGTWLLKAGGLRLQERLVEGPQVHAYVSEVSPSEGINIRDLSNACSGPVFHRMVHHLLIGRKIIIRGTSEHLITAIVQSLKPLVPKHCFRAINFSEQYVTYDTWNILGLHPSAGILNRNDMFVIDVMWKDGSYDMPLLSNSQSLSTYPGAEDRNHMGKTGYELGLSPAVYSNYLKNCMFKVTLETFLPARPPQVLNRIESAIGNPTLTSVTLLMYISTVIYEWTNKVKVWIHVQNKKKPLLTSSAERVPSQASIHPSVIFRSSSIPVLQIPSSSSLRTPSPHGITGSPPETTPQDERHQLLAAIGCTEWDIPLLEFWAAYFTQT
ncbi:hypothetical protein SK128_014228 [Halocaridina rubra]|uniref:Folliculin n=1 Tax=Halocaridina rubra TaxID=373956 RepID=A0AAN9A9V6_HALRR